MKKIQNHKDNFTITANKIFKDKTIALKTKGLFMLMWSLPEDWNFTVRGLSSICKEGTNSVNNSIKELEELGYLIREYKRDDKGHIKKTNYIISDIPSPNLKNPVLKNQDMDNQDMDNQDNNKEKKELKKELTNNIENKVFFENSDLDNLFKDFLASRPKKKNTEKSIKMLVKKLKDFTYEEQEEAIEQSIAAGWDGIFPKKKFVKPKFEEVDQSWKTKYLNDEE